jgi:hypothetical protein
MASPVVAGGCVYVVNGTVLGAFDVATGERQFQERLTGFRSVVASPIAVDGKVMILDETGAAVVLKAGPRFEILGHSKLEDMFWSSPAIARDTLLLRGVQALYCVGQPRTECD